MKHRNHKTATRSLIASAITALLVLPLGNSYAVASQGKQVNKAPGNETMLTGEATVADKSGWNDPALAETASHEGRVLLRQVKDVQTALKVGDVDGARHALKAAKDFVETLKPLMPYEIVSNELTDSDGKVVEAGADVAVDQMLPIYGDVSTVTAYAPDEADAAQNGDRAKASSAKGDTEIVGTDISATAVYLPVLYFENRIDLASKALDASPADTGSASRAINDALSSLVFSQTNVHLLPGDNGSESS